MENQSYEDRNLLTSIYYAFLPQHAESVYLSEIYSPQLEELPQPNIWDLIEMFVAPLKYLAISLMIAVIFCWIGLIIYKKYQDRPRNSQVLTYIFAFTLSVFFIDLLRSIVVNHLVVSENIAFNWNDNPRIELLHFLDYIKLDLFLYVPILILNIITLMITVLLPYSLLSSSNNSD